MRSLRAMTGDDSGSEAADDGDNDHAEAKVPLDAVADDLTTLGGTNGRRRAEEDDAPGQRVTSEGFDEREAARTTWGTTAPPPEADSPVRPETGEAPLMLLDDSLPVSFVATRTSAIREPPSAPAREPDSMGGAGAGMIHGMILLSDVPDARGLAAMD